MPEISEVFEDAGKGIKKTLKNKPFMIAAIVVGGVALYLGYKKYNGGGGESEAVGYSAIGYAGYPTTTGGVGDSYEENTYIDSYFESILEQMDMMQQQTDSALNDMSEDFNNQLNGVYDEISGIYDEMGNNVSYFDKVTVTPEAVGADTDWYYERQAILDQMAANSDAFHMTDSKEMRDKLHEENKALGEYLGLTYDSGSGLWMDGNSVAYVTDMQQQISYDKKKAGSASGASGFVSNKEYTEKVASAIKTNTTATTFDPSMDYQAEINKAISSGASAAIIDKLNAQRNAKIAASGGSTAKANTTYDANTDYQALINKAKASGASKSVIDNLTAQRNAKIAAQSAKKTTTTTTKKPTPKATNTKAKNTTVSMK